MSRKVDDSVQGTTTLTRIKVQFILAINDVPDTPGTFARFDIVEVVLNYTAATDKGVSAKEFIGRGK